jgi:NAD(P)-dependent dehydrogenase (short-subunit alcohol dehydrogenase family)
MRVEGSSAIVTGGASGLGLATAEYLSGRGMHVVIADLPSSDGADVAKRPGLHFVPADVTDSGTVQAAVAAPVQRGPPRVLVTSRTSSSG